MTHTVSRTHDTLAHVLDAQGRRVSRHDLISDADKEAERLNNLETTMPVETSETMADLVAKAQARFEALSPVDQALHISDQRRSFLRGMGADTPPPDVLADEVRRLRAANAQLWREIAAGLTTEEPAVGALWPMVADVSGSLAAVRLHFRNEVAAHNATKAERDAAVRERDEARTRAVTCEAMIAARGTNRDYQEARAVKAEAQRDAAIRERDEARESFELLWRAERERDRLAAVWKDAYAAFIGAFDTPLARRRDNSEFAQDARRRLSEYDHLTPATEAPKDGE